MDHAPDLLHLLVRALAQFAVSLDGWFHIPWPLPIAALFLPVLAALDGIVWYLRGRVFPIPCDYPTTKQGNCRRPAIGEWHRCWQHRKRKWRKTDRHLVDPSTRRWENRLRKGVSVETGEVQGRGFLGMRSRRDTLLYRQGFARWPRDVFKIVPAVFRDYRTRIARRWSELRSLGLAGIFGVTERGKRLIATSHLLPGVIRATRLTLFLVVLGLALVIASVPSPPGFGVVFEYSATYSFIFAVAIMRTGILKADGATAWLRSSLGVATKWIAGLTCFAALGGLVALYSDEFVDVLVVAVGTVFTGGTFLAIMFFYLLSKTTSRRRRRGRRRRRY